MGLEPSKDADQLAAGPALCLPALGSEARLVEGKGKAKSTYLAGTPVGDLGQMGDFWRRSNIILNQNCMQILEQPPPELGTDSPT